MRIWRRYLPAFGKAGLAFIALCGSAMGEAAEQPSYPDDPFREDRALLPAREIGTASGQVQFSMLGALISGKSSDEKYVGGQLDLEFMMNEFGGMRITSFQELTKKDGGGLDHKLSSFRVGPALHFNPYHAVDYGTYVEGGVVTADAIKGRTSIRAPEVAIGAFVTMHLNSFWFVRAELSRTWANFDIDTDAVTSDPDYLRSGKVAASQQRTTGFFGLGVAF